MRIQNWTAVFIAVLFLLVSGCSPQPAPASPSPAPTQAPTKATAAAPTQSPVQAPTKAVTQAPAKPTWQEDWDKTVAAAKKEGTIVVLTGVAPNVRNALSEGIKKAYGINAEFVVGRSAEIAQKLASERRAGLYLADIFIGGATDPVNTFKPTGVIDPIEPLLVSELVEPGKWLGGKLTYIDQEKKILPFSSKVQYSNIIINTEMVGPNEVKGYRDLLNPKWKGKIAIYDPTLPGIGLRWFGIVSMKILDMDYMKKLALQEPAIVRDARQQVEWVARGKYPIGMPAEPPIVYEFIKLGSPLKGVFPVEGLWVASGWGNICVINKPAHPNAAKVFLNWLLTKEGQTAYSLASGDPSRRTDVPTAHLDPEVIPQPGKEYIVSEEEGFLLKQLENAKIAKEIFQVP